MLKAFITHLKKYQTLLILIFSLFIFLLGTILYFYNREVTTNRELSIALHNIRVEQKCQQANVRLVEKIRAVSERMEMDKEVWVVLLSVYDEALELSKDENIKCLMLERWGDDVWMAYNKGVRDGRKALFGGV